MRGVECGVGNQMHALGSLQKSIGTRNATPLDLCGDDGWCVQSTVRSRPDAVLWGKRVALVLCTRPELARCCCRIVRGER